MEHSSRRRNEIDRLQRCVAAFALAVGLLGASIAHAQTPDDLSAWLTTESRGTAEGYRAYLAQFPNGQFVALARIRLQAAARNPATPAAAPANADPDPESPHFSVTPPAGRLGQLYVVDCGTLPDDPRSMDVIIVVAAGSPSTDATPPLTSPNIVFSQYTSNCKLNNGVLPGFGPLPPGRWEFRWMTSLYTVQRRLEMKAKVDLVVR